MLFDFEVLSLQSLQTWVWENMTAVPLIGQCLLNVTAVPLIGHWLLNVTDVPLIGH